MIRQPLVFRVIIIPLFATDHIEANLTQPSTSSSPGTGLLHCPRTGEGVKMCQSKGKAVILSLGGAAGAYGFSDDAEAKDFAHTIWNLFLGGSSGTRPLDDAILDGVDLE